MASLTVDGILFSSGNKLNSKRQIFALNTAWTFYQNTTPTGWTKVTTHDNKALRVVSGAGGNFGGTNSFTSTLSSKSMGGTVNFNVVAGGHSLTIPEITSHLHPNGGEIGLSANSGSFNPDGTQTDWSGGDVARPPFSGNNFWTRTSPSTSNQGSGDTHSHPNGNASGAMPSDRIVNLDVQYIDIIVCTFNG